MIPSVFISSTIEDLHHLRDAIRDTITELGYNPVMSEYGDIGYLPEISVEDSCYLSFRECQLGIFIIGKRYGNIMQNGMSITHNEFKVAKEKHIPMIFLVEEDILSYKQIYDSNEDGNQKLKMPGMDNPTSTFTFLNEFISSDVNNGYLPFKNVAEARNHIKTQLAKIFGDLLVKKYDPLKSDLKDVLSEIKTLRHELLKDKQEEYLPYLMVLRYLLADENSDYYKLLESIYGYLDSAIPTIIDCDSFTKVVESGGGKIKIVEDFPLISNLRASGELENQILFRTYRGTETEGETIIYQVNRDKTVLLNENALQFFEIQHAVILELAKRGVERALVKNKKSSK